MIAQLDKHYIRVNKRQALRRVISYAAFEGRPLTTKGQWINRIVLPWLRLISSVSAPRKVDRPIFIVGTGRSGTTVLGVMLSMHSRVGFLNEPKAIWATLLPEEDLIGTYSRRSARYRLDASDVQDDTKARSKRIYGWYLSLLGVSRVVDKYPELVFRLPMVTALFPDAKILFLVRSGAATCQSINNWSSRNGQSSKDEMHDWWGADRRKWKLLVSQVASKDEYFKNHVGALSNLNSHVEMAAVEWILSMKEGMRAEQMYPESVFRVRYEDLAERPEDTLRAILFFCGLEQSEYMSRYAELTLYSPPKYDDPRICHEFIMKAYIDMMNKLGYV